MIPDELIERIRDSADLVEIIGESVSLKRTGADYRGPCPFHGGSHRNFAVIPKKGMYYCYVCHEAGDVFTYLMKRQGLDYPSAVREVGRRAGISVPEQGGREGPDPREPLFTAVAAAEEWFAERLRDDPEAEAARSYLAGRDIPLEVAAEHRLGFAPRGGFKEAMGKLGLEEATMLEAGLLLRREDGSIGARFRGRLLFPICDLRGRPVGFGGRLLGPGEPKYLNSPESPVFHKGGMLYNLHQAKQAIRREETAILVEGYFDVFRLVLAGIDNVVAPLGTALTPDQAALIRRFAPVVILLYDSDTAGLRATFRAADEALRHKLRVRVATMPEGEDPDTLVRKGGAAALAPILKDAVDVLERKIQLLERKGWFEGIEHRREALDRLLPTAEAAADPITRELYLNLIEERTRVSRPVLEQELAARPRPVPIEPSRAAARGPAPARQVAKAGAGRVRPGARIEAKLLQVMLASPGWLARARTEVPATLFEVASFREIFGALANLPEGEAAAAVVPLLSPRAQEVWNRLMTNAAGDLSAGHDLDAEYVGALDYLRARETTRALPPLSEVDERRNRLDQLPLQARQRLSFRKAAEKAPRRGEGRAGGPDPTQHS
ncbi:MAG: DNA primase [Gemmatimonadales bacterium]